MLQFSKEKLERICGRYANWILSVQTENTDVPIFFVAKDNIIVFLDSICREEGFEYSFLADLTAVDDNPPTDKIVDYGLGVVPAERVGEPRFHVVYQLLSMQYKDRIRVKVPLADGESTPSVVSLWPAANWPEREVFDFYGIKFDGHPNMVRIMLDQRWKGHPQRKDYPMKRYQRFEGSLEITSSGLVE